MKSSVLRILGLALALGCSSARATLIGDTITVAHHFTNLGSVIRTFDIAVQAGAGDLVPSPNSSFPYSVNPEASSVLVRFTTNDFWTSAAFNGIVVSGINDTVTGVTVSTNLVGWSNSRISYDAHSVSSNWQGLSFTTATYFDITINPSTAPAGTPDTGTTAALLGVVLLGLAAMRLRLV